MKKRYLFASFVGLGAMTVSTTAFAGGLNDWSCKPLPGRYPVVLAHGRGGDANSMPAMVNALSGGGYCVFALSYGKMNGKGSYGMAHLDQSGGEFAAFTDKVLAATGASQIDAIGYSEGGMVIDNFILTKGGAGRVHRYIGLAGAHYPYASEGYGIGATGNLYCPTFISTMQNAFPPFTSGLTSKEIMQMAVTIAPGAFNDGDKEVVQSDFVVDLFDAKYWMRTHGGLSEGTNSALIAMTGTSYRTFNTPKATAPNICYTNIISPGDGFVGAATAYGDKNFNVVNQLAPTTVGHGDVPKDQTMIQMMMVALGTPILPGNPVNCGGQAPEPDQADKAHGEGNSGGSSGGSYGSPDGGASANPGDPSGPNGPNGNAGGGTDPNDPTTNGASAGGTDDAQGSGDNPFGEPGSSGCTVGFSRSTPVAGFASLALVGLVLARRRARRAA